MKEILAKIVRSLKDDNTSPKAVQKLLINSVGERDYSAQETCHLLLQLLMFKASRDFIVLSLDRSCAVEEQLDEDQPATALSILDHYIARPTTPRFQNMKLRSSLCSAIHHAQGTGFGPIPQEKGCCGHYVSLLVS